MEMIVDGLLRMAAAVTGLVMAPTSANFVLLQAAVALLIGVAIVGLIVFLLRRR